jgi:hypothetical protein
MAQAADLTPMLGAGTDVLWYRKINQESVVGIGESPSSITTIVSRCLAMAFRKFCVVECREFILGGKHCSCGVQESMVRVSFVIIILSFCFAASKALYIALFHGVVFLLKLWVDLSICSRSFCRLGKHYG